MDYTVLSRTTTPEDRELLMKFLELPPQKILMYASAILSAYIKTFSEEKSKDLLLETVIKAITEDVKKKTVMVTCSFCEKGFYTYVENMHDPQLICPTCALPDLQKGD